MKVILILLLTVSMSAQSETRSTVREAFMKVALRATLRINRQDSTPQTIREADNALDEVKIESISPEEDAVFKLLMSFKHSVRTNIATRVIIDNQLEMSRILNRPDYLAQTQRAAADNDEMDKRENACVDAIQDMLRREISVNIPACNQVALKAEEMKTRLEKY